MIIQTEAITTLDFNIVRILLAFGLLGIASFLDLKKREIHDILWICFGVAGVILLLFELGNENFLLKTAFATIVIPIVFVMWKLGLFGGADVLAVTVLAILVPFTTISGEQITPFTTLTNAGILSLTVLIINASKNMNALLKNEIIFKDFDESRSRKIIAFFIGTRSRNPKFGFSIQKVVGNRKKLDFSLSHAENSMFCDIPYSWVTPGIPFILYLSGGFVVQVVFGDLLFEGLNYLHIM